MNNSHSESYAAAGVDIEAGYKGVQLMKQHVERTRIPGVVSGIGGFGGLFAPDVSGMAEPILVSGTDGVGTKIRIAQLLDRHDTIGIDCVAMCVNDIVCCGARPLFFLDYIAIGKNEPEKVASIVSGVAEGCVRSGCALVGGETAEHPGVMSPDDYDLAGFAVGLVDKAKMIDNTRMKAGDVILALPSSGLHSNGFSLVRKVFDIEHADLSKPLDELDGKSLGLQEKGGIPERDMFNTFNMGTGMVLVVDKEDVVKAVSALDGAGESPRVIGTVVSGGGVELL